MKAYLGKPVLAIDFDGTIRKSKRAIDTENEIMPYCKRVLEKLHFEGYRMILWTCRSKAWLEEPIKLMIEWDILKYFECINENVKQVYWWNTKKVYADCYIDDLNLQGFPGWLETYRILKKRFPNG